LTFFFNQNFDFVLGQISEKVSVNAQQNITMTMAEKEQFEERVKSLQKELAARDAQVEELQAENESLHAMIQNKDGELDDMRADHHRLNDSLEQAEIKIRNYEDILRIRDAEDEKEIQARLLSQEERFRAELEEAQLKIRQYQDSEQTFCAEKEKEFQAQIFAQEEKFRLEREQAQETIKQHRDKEKDFESRLLAQEENVRKELSHALSTKHAEEVSSLQENLDKVTAELEISKAKVSSEEEKSAVIAEQNENLKDNLEKITAELAISKAKVCSAEQQSTAIAQQNECLTRELEDIKATKQTVDEVQVTLASNTAEVESLRKELQEKDRIHDAEISNLIIAHKDATLRQSQEYLAKQQEMAQASAKALSDVERQKKVLEARCNAAKQQFAEFLAADEKLEALQKTADDLKSQLEVSRSQVKNLEDELRNAKDQIDNLEKAAEEASCQIPSDSFSDMGAIDASSPDVQLLATPPQPAPAKEPGQADAVDGAESSRAPPTPQQESKHGKWTIASNRFHSAARATTTTEWLRSTAGTLDVAADDEERGTVGVLSGTIDCGVELRVSSSKEAMHTVGKNKTEAKKEFLNQKLYIFRGYKQKYGVFMKAASKSEQADTLGWVYATCPHDEERSLAAPRVQVDQFLVLNSAAKPRPNSRNGWWVEEKYRRVSF
jgi:hypothetical protein